MPGIFSAVTPGTTFGAILSRLGIVAFALTNLTGDTPRTRPGNGFVIYPEISDFDGEEEGDRLIFRGMDQQNGQWIQSPLTGAPNGRQLGARTMASNPQYPDFRVMKPTEIVGFGTEGLSGNYNPTTAMASRGTNLGVITQNTLIKMGFVPLNDHDDHVSIKPPAPLSFETVQRLYNSIPWFDIPFVKVPDTDPRTGTH